MTVPIAADEIENKVERSRKTKDDSQEKVTYDTLLSAAGEFGCYQLLLFFATFPFYASGVFAYYSQMFMTEVSPNHWCWIPELKNLTDMHRRNIAIPTDEKSQFGYSQCRMYDVNWTDLLITGQTPYSNSTTVPCKHGWEFNKTEIPYPTISSELGWVCDKNSYQAQAQAIFFIGSMIGGIIIGWVSDRFGRIQALVASNILGCVGGVASTFARNFAEFASARFVMGMAYDNCMMMAYLLILEYVAPKYRTLISNVSFATFYSLVVTLLPWIALACGNWKTFSLVTSAPLALVLFAPFIIPESPRWLLSKGRIDDAINKLQSISRINKKEIQPELIEKFKSTLSETREETQSFFEILKRPLMRRIFILICIEYMCCAIVFDGLVRSIGQLDFDFFVSFSVISSTEFPSLLLMAFIMDWMGRRWLLLTCLSMGCLFTILTIFGSAIASVIFAGIARFAINMSYTASMQWVAELLPTPVRGSGASVVHICGYLATVLSPYIVYLNIYVYWLPATIIGSLSLLGALIAFNLPETARKEMPHTFEDAEEMIRNQKFWSVPCLENKREKEGQTNASFELES